MKRDSETRKPQLVHSARQMFEARWAKYNDPTNLDWEFDVDMSHANKWERHAWSAYLDLVATESERDAVIAENETLKSLLLTAAELHHRDCVEHRPESVSFADCQSHICVQAKLCNQKG